MVTGFTELNKKVATRPPWDTYFMEIAHLVATRSTPAPLCEAVIVGQKILAPATTLPAAWRTVTK